MSYRSLSSMHPVKTNTTLSNYLRELTGFNILARADNTTALVVENADSTTSVVKPKGMVVTGSVFDYLDLTALEKGPLPWAVVEVLDASNPQSVHFLEVSYVDAEDALNHIEAINEKNVVGLASKVGLSYVEIEKHIEHFNKNVAYHVVVEPGTRDGVVEYGIYHSFLNAQVGKIIHNSRNSERSAIILSGYTPRTLADAINYLK